MFYTIIYTVISDPYEQKASRTGVAARKGGQVRWFDWLIAARVSEPERAGHVDWARVRKWARLSKIRLRAKEECESKQQEKNCKKEIVVGCIVKLVRNIIEQSELRR